MPFKTINAADIGGNAIRLFGETWALLSAGKEDHFNAMTISWGGLGQLWMRPVATCYVRPSRYTYEFMESCEYYTLSFFDEQYRPALSVFGDKSGRDTDKVSETGLTPAAGASGAVYFEEARLVIVCKKLYRRDFEPADFITDEIPKNYDYEDFHRMYIGEIVEVLEKDPVNTDS